MVCKKPFFQGTLAFGCGQCNPCRINRRRLWGHRLQLEQLKHSDSAFVTLTYDDDHLPEGGTLVPKHPQDWLKRIRRKIEPSKIRYYLVGEYGEKTGRPHYHAIIFGLSYHGPDAQLMQDTWGKGGLYFGDLTKDSAAYVTGYITKKWTNKNDPKVQQFLKGRHEEFARMSKRPGLGALTAIDIASSLTTNGGAILLETLGDVPSVLKHGKKSQPLGRYLKEKIREAYGFKEKGTPKEKLKEWSMQLSELLEVAINSTEDPTQREKNIKNVYINDQKILNMETRHNIFNKKGSL